jgi:Cu2+-exporting ATPase
VHLSRTLGSLAALGYPSRGFDATAAEATQAGERRAILWRLFVAAFAMMQVMMYLLPVYIADGDMTGDAEQLMRWASFLLTVPVMLWSAGPFFASAWRDARARRVGMDAPVSLGIGAAFAASAWATVSGSGDVYFDSITMFVFLLLGARYLEAQARARASESRERLVRHMPAVADRLVPGAAGVTERVAVARLALGDRVCVAPGSTIPADGTVIEGRSAADQSLLTGESRPVAKGAGDAVIGGSINLASPLTIAVTRVGAESVLAGIIRLMDRAQASRPRIAQLADRVAQWFVLALLAIAAATGGLWYALEPERALWVTIAVLVVSCPCALSLATPAALAAATGALHRAGLLIVRGHALETLSKVTHVVFDKTGTLTMGRMSLVELHPLGTYSRDDCLALAARLERDSEHAIAGALRAAAPMRATSEAEALANHPGRGIEARVGGERVRLGSPAFVAELAQSPLPDALGQIARHLTPVLLGDEHGYRALLGFADDLRPGAAALVRELQARGLTVCLLSGDRRSTVDAIACRLGVDHAIGEASPEAKLAHVRALQADGACVAMIGDGINDAPVLGCAQVSIAMGGGTDLAQASADMVLVADDLRRLPAGFAVARRTLGVIRQNLLWALAYNLVAIPLAALGWITPLIAGGGMAASSLLVVLNALRLQCMGDLTGARFSMSGAAVPSELSRALMKHPG